MNRIALICAVAAAVGLAHAVPARGAGTEPPSAAASGSGVAEARALVRQGRFLEALAVLRPAVAGPAVEAGALFQFGLASVGAAQAPGLAAAEREAFLDDAIAAFHTMLVGRPELVRVRLELARAFFLKGQDDLARQHFERVLAGEPPAPVVANVNRFLAQIRARRRWSLHLGAAVAPDTNIGRQTDVRTVYLPAFGQNRLFRFERDQYKRSGVGLSVWTGGEYQHPLGERMRLRAGASVSRREYSGSRFDRMLVSGHVGPRWFLDRDAEASALASVRRGWLGSVPDYDDLGLRLESGRRLGRHLTTHARASWHDRRYRTRTAFDGPVADLSAGGAWLLTPTLRADATAGWGRDRPDAVRGRNTRTWMRLGATAILPWGFTVRGAGELLRADYKGRWLRPSAAVGDGRRDTTRSLRVSVHHRAFTLMGFSPQLSLISEQRKSDAVPYDYKRTSGELSFVRQF